MSAHVVAHSLHMNVKPSLEFAEFEHAHPGTDVRWGQDRLVELETVLKAVSRRQQSKTPANQAQRAV